MTYFGFKTAYNKKNNILKKLKVDNYFLQNVHKKKLFPSKYNLSQTYSKFDISCRSLGIWIHSNDKYIL